MDRVIRWGLRLRIRQLVELLVLAVVVIFSGTFMILNHTHKTYPSDVYKIEIYDSSGTVLSNTVYTSKFDFSSIYNKGDKQALHPGELKYDWAIEAIDGRITWLPKADLKNVCIIAGKVIK